MLSKGRKRKVPSLRDPKDEPSGPHMQIISKLSYSLLEEGPAWLLRDVVVVVVIVMRGTTDARRYSATRKSRL